MSRLGCWAPPIVFSVRCSVSLKANWYASDKVTLPSPLRSPAPRSPLTSECVKNEPFNLSLSWLDSSCVLLVMNA